MATVCNKNVPSDLINYLESFLVMADRGWRLSSKTVYAIIKKDPNYVEKAAHYKALCILKPEGVQVQVKHRKLSICVREFLGI